MLLTVNDIRCHTSTCDIRGRCLRALTPVPFGGASTDYSIGAHNCVGKFIPAPPEAVKAPEAVVHEHPGGVL
jgi:hypothetical protein